MSFEVHIGTTSDSRKVVNKTFTSKYDLTGTLKAECDIKNPRIQLRIGDSQNIKIPDITVCNYAYIPNFNRYYYIVDFVSIRDTILEVQMSEDVLKSFSDEIYKQKGIVSRTESTAYYTSMLDDPDVYHYADTNIVIQKLASDDTAFSKSGSYVMVTAGPSAAT